MFALPTALFIAAVSAGIFLRAKTKTILIAAAAALAVGGGLFFAAGKILPELCCLAAGAASALAVFAFTEKRGISDCILFFFTEASYCGLYRAFCSGFAASGGMTVVQFIFLLLFLCHIPAMLMSFDALRLQRGWRSRIKGVRRYAVPAVCLAAALMIWALSFMSTSGTAVAIVKLLLASLIFWMGLGLTVLLVSSGHERDKSIEQTAYHDDMNTFMNVVRSQRHDYNLHVQTVASLIAQEKWDECRDYVNALVRDTSQMNAVLPVKDPAVAALIHNYRIQAAQNGITLTLDIRDDLSQVVTSAYETNKLIGNLLQNALDELSGRDEPGEIELMIFKRGDNCLVRVSNNLPDPAAFAARQADIFRQGFTTKHGHDGVGLSSIKALANEKGGDVTCWLEDDIVHFTVAIPLMHTVKEEQNG